MELSVFKDLSEDSREIAEITQLLQYSLHLNIKNHHTLQPDIDQIFSVCHDICKPLFKPNFNFFGNDDLGHTNAESLEKLYSNYRDDDFWITAVKYHCAISSLFTIRNNFFKDSRISAYHLDGHARDFGFLSLKEKGYLQDNLFKNYITSTETARDYSSSDCSNFKTMFKTFCSSLTPQEQEAMYYDPKQSTFSLENSDYVYRMFKNRKHFMQIHKYFLHETNSTPISHFSHFFNEVADFSKSFYATRNEENIVDQILLIYRTERYYNLSLTAELYNRLLKLFSMKKSVDFKMPNTSILSTCFTLPNVFSRNLFLSYAFDSYSNAHLEENYFYYRNKNSGPLSYTSLANLGVDNHLTWENLFKSYNLFFSRIIFPIYEKCFFILLKEAFELKEICPGNSGQIMEELNRYILTNSHDIMSGGYSSTKTREHLAADSSCNIRTPSIPDMKILIARDDKIRFNLALKDIIARQNNLINSKDAPLFNSDSFSMQLSTDEHQALLTLYVNSTLRYMSGQF